MTIPKCSLTYKVLHRGRLCSRLQAATQKYLVKTSFNYKRREGYPWSVLLDRTVPDVGTGSC